MKQLVAMLVLLMFVSSMCHTVWASSKEQDYSASKQAVFNATVKVIQKDWNITFMDRESGIISFKTGTSLRSNGMECQVSVIAVSETETKLRVGAQKTGGQWVAWGAGGSIASKIFKGVEDELNSSAHAAVIASSPAVAPTQADSSPPVQEAAVQKPLVSSLEASGTSRPAVSPNSPAAAPIRSPASPPAQSGPAVASASAVGQTIIEFTSEPSGAEIEVDGNYAGNTPSTETLAPGEHTIRISKSGYKAWERKTKTSAGHINVAAKLQKEASPLGVPTTIAQPSRNASTQASPAVATAQPASNPSVQRGTVEFLSVPAQKATLELWSRPDAAYVEVDGKYLGRTPLTIEVEAGQHAIRMRKQGCRTWQRTINVTSGTLRVPAYMEQLSVTLH
jgi:hypothetical protein